MKLCYQVATSDVAIADSVATYQGSPMRTFGDLGTLGHDGAELMTLDLGELDWREVEGTAEESNSPVMLVCTGEILGQLGLNYVHSSRSVCRETMGRVKEIIGFVGYLGANVNIGRIRRQYCRELGREEIGGLVQSVSAELVDYAVPKKMGITPETAAIIWINFTSTLAEGAAVVNRVGGLNFHLVMNISHLNLEERGLYEAIRAYGSYNIHVHLAGSNRRYSGQYDLDFEKILTVFKEYDYDSNYCTEIFQFSSMGETARESIRYLRPIADRVHDRSTHRSQVNRSEDDNDKNRKEGIQI